MALAMLAPLNSLLCRHEYFWSERHHAERCRRCQHLREDSHAAFAIPEPAPRLPDFNETMRDDPVDWRRPRSAASAEVSNVPDGASLRRETTQRRALLLEHLAALEAGEPLERKAVLDLTMAVIEDAHSSEPLLFGQDTAAHFARLHAARTGFPGAE